MQTTKPIIAKIFRRSAHALTGAVLTLTIACGGSSGGDAAWLLAGLGLGPRSLPEDAALPASGSDVGGGRSPAYAPTPEGSDLFSISTNYSAAVDDPETKADPLAGTAYVAPPQPNHYGTLSFSYPVEVPAGRAGVQPGISLGYSAAAGDGWVGIGWNLGLGAITRTTEYGAPFYDHRDVFTYNGKRLVKVNGPSNSEDGVYREEITSSAMMRFELSNSASGGTWTVRSSAGTVTTYGSSTDSRIHRPDDSTQTYSWYFARTEDRNGNYMEAVYDTSHYADDNVLYLEEIRYTGNSNAGHNPRQYVRFTTRARDTGYGAYVSKAPGFLMRMDRLLDSIEVGYNGSELWSYNLVYETSEDSHRPRLRTVDSNRTTTRPEFLYQTSSRQLLWNQVPNQAANDPEVNPKATQYFEGDFNGDGISDLVFFNPENGSWKAAEGRRGGGFNYRIYGYKFQGYNSEDRIVFFQSGLTGDFNGDGRADIVMYTPENREFWIAQHDGRVFQFRNFGRLLSMQIDPAKADLFPGDFDGNGVSDALFFNEPTGEWLLALNKDGTRFEYRVIARQFQHLYRDDYSPDATLNSAATSDASAKDRGKIRFLSGDFNADGRSDVSFYDERNGHWWVGENHPDVNTVFRLHWKIYKVFSAPEQALFAQERFTGDFNGDGFSDFLLFDRNDGRWILGETGDETITFRVWSTAPQHKEITRWLQGDFNGDGRTDVGFFSANDNNFWIGEATPAGLRYRVYSNMSYGPDAARVMQTPLPEDEVELKSARAVIRSASASALLDFQYDGNNRPYKGEQVFAGCFTGADCITTPELLIFDRKSESFYLKQGAGAPNLVLSGVNPLEDGATLLFDGVPGRYTQSAKDELLYHDSINTGSTNHRFRIVRENNGFEDITLAQFDSSDVTNFQIGESAFLVDHFDATNEKSVLVLDDQRSTARFLLVRGTTKTPLTFGAGALSAQDFKNVFQQGGYPNRLGRGAFSFFSADFDGDGYASVLLVDRSSSTHRYYLGALSGTTITWTLLNGTPAMVLPFTEHQSELNAAGIAYRLRPESGGARSIVYSKVVGGSLRFFKLTVSGTAVSQSTHFAPHNYQSFAGEYDHEGNPILRGASGAIRFNLANNQAQALTSNHVQRSLDRPDLLTKVYPFRWLQGDYNGDGLTDIGIFHLKEPVWYFALSNGKLPDIVDRVLNGIGGSYHFEFAHSTEFDNTGPDDVPDLPARSLLLTKVTVDDGLNRRYETRYEYSDGSLQSRIISGRKEIDSFGFGRFVARDALNRRTISLHHATPYANFMENRALGGAVREVQTIGSDNVLHRVSKYEYRIHTIEERPGARSYLAETIRSEERVRGTLVSTSTQNLNLVSNRYEVAAITNTATDHYSDSTHSAATITSVTNFETIAATNQQRPVSRVSLSGTAHETTTAYVYDGNGNVSRTTLTNTGTGLPAVAPRITETDYDSYGNVTETRDVSSTPTRVVQTLYDSQLHQFVVRKRHVGDSLNIDTNYNIDYGPAFGAPYEIIDANGEHSYHDYDGYGRLVAVRADTPAGTSGLSAYSYSTDFPLSARTTLHTGTSDPSFVSRSYVDGLGRDLQTVKTASGGNYVRSGVLIYDGAGRLEQRGQSEWAGAAEIDSYYPDTSAKHPTRYEYDGAGRVAKTTLPLNEGETSPTTITVHYQDPYIVTESHSGGQAKRITRNGRGQVLYVRDFGTGDDAQLVDAEIGFCYDIAGNRTKKADLNGATMSCADAGGAVPAKDTSGQNRAYWRHDAFGQLREMSDPDFGVAYYTYNAFGDMITQTDARALTTNLSYDRLGRISTKLLPAGEGLVSYTYDSYGSNENTIGRLALIEDSVQSKEFSYDELGRVKREIREIENIGVTALDVPYITEYRYDHLGRVKSVDYPEHPTSNHKIRVCYDYGTAGYVTGITTDTDAGGYPLFGGACGSNTKTIVSNIGYNEFGQTASFTLGNGVTTSYTHDVRGRITNLHSSGIVSGASKVLQNTTYEFNPNNSIASVSNSSTDYSTTYNYTYDGLNRLISANGMYTDNGSTTTKFRRAYGYADNGNLIRKDELDPDTTALLDRWTFNYTNHAVTSIDSTSYGVDRITMTYDAVGNAITQNDAANSFEKTLSFDSRNRIVNVYDVDRQVTVGEYRYDDGGFRVQKNANMLKGGVYKDVNILYPSMFFGLEHVPEDSSTDSVNNIYLNGVRVAAMAQNGALAYYLTDQVDSVSHVLDDQAETLTRIQYKPYGETFVHEGDQDFAPKYNSQELDSESRFYYFNARHYDPQVARFVSADTVIDGGPTSTQGWNRYMYVRGNPIKYKDPTGHDAIDGQFRGLEFSDFFPNASEPRYVAEEVHVTAPRYNDDIGGVVRRLNDWHRQTTNELQKANLKQVAAGATDALAQMYQTQAIVTTVIVPPLLLYNLSQYYGTEMINDSVSTWALTGLSGRGREAGKRNIERFSFAFSLFDSYRGKGVPMPTGGVVGDAMDATITTMIVGRETGRIMKNQSLRAWHSLPKIKWPEWKLKKTAKKSRLRTYENLFESPVPNFSDTSRPILKHGLEETSVNGVPVLRVRSRWKGDSK